ncbi:hypothetical protein FJZ17_02185 [Candidatus Pacearchaeota archaeon]|nr:hypothetical protein [Candidatus Pacearchaeota archaeon]
MSHTKKIRGYRGTPEQLARNIGNTRYDTTLRFDEARAREYHRQALQDRAAGHPRLATLLAQYANLLEQARDEMRKIWDLCKNKPGMQD